MWKIYDVAVFIYQTKHIEVPRFITLEPIEKKNLSPARLSFNILIFF